MSTSSDGLENMTALITGADGFIGRALCNRLLQAGANVIGLDLNASPLGLSSRVQYHQVDILNFDHLHDILKTLQLENPVVFHLAGQSNVGKSRTEPLSTWAVNVTGTMHLLEACRRLAINRIIFPSTALVYARPAPLPLAELAPALVD